MVFQILWRIYEKGYFAVDETIDNANRFCASSIIESIDGYKDRCIACLTIGDSIKCNISALLNSVLLRTIQNTFPIVCVPV